MAATAAMRAEVRRIVDEPTTTTYDDDLLDSIIEGYPLLDALGTEPQDIDYSTTPPTISEADNWIPTYDLNAAAQNIWSEKAAAVADEFDFSAVGGNYKRSQKYEDYMKNSRYFGSRRALKSSTVFVYPRPSTKESSNAD